MNKEFFRLILFSIAVVATIFLSAEGFAQSNPELIVREFLERVRAEDIDAAYELISEDERVRLRVSPDALLGTEIGGQLWNLAYTEYRVEIIDINGSEAVIGVSYQLDNDVTLSVTLVEEEDGWKLTELGKVFSFANPTILSTEVPTFPDRLEVEIPIPPPIYTNLPNVTESEELDEILETLLSTGDSLPTINGFARQIDNQEWLDLSSCDENSKIRCIEKDDHLVFLTRVDVDDAYMLRLHLQTEGVAEENLEEIVFWTWSGDEVENAIRVDGTYRSEDGTLWTPTILGPSAWLQIEVTKNAAGGAILIDEVLQTFPLNEEGRPIILKKNGNPIREEFRDPITDPLGIDATCVEGMELAKQATVLITTFSERGDVVFAAHCTGTSIVSNKVPKDFFILTANHCIPKNVSACDALEDGNECGVSQMEIYWEYRTQECHDGAPFLGNEILNLPRSKKVKLLVRRCESDVALLLVEPIEGDHAALGWTTSPILPLVAHRISHPKGVAQAYTQHQIKDEVTTSFSNCRFPVLSNEEQIVSNITKGAIEDNSSGAVLIAPSGNILGQGASWISEGDKTYRDGHFLRSWESLKQFLE